MSITEKTSTQPPTFLEEHGDDIRKYRLPKTCILKFGGIPFAITGEIEVLTTPDLLTRDPGCAEVFVPVDDD